MRKRLRVFQITTIAILAGSCFQLGACAQYVSRLNPCGTILNCDPVEYRFVRGNYDGPGVDPDLDPSCTYPPFCDNDPFVSSPDAGG
jgi:hypothetical protein